jgi:tRNA dimethylallyltransferase
MQSSGPLVVVVGPTASGKSALAMRIAQQHNGEIIAADSRTVYRGMDIGTAKPTVEDQQLVPHYLIDVRNPDEPFSAADFKKLAEEAIADIQSRGKLPVMVGGTGLYVDAVLFDYQFGPAANQAERERLNGLSVDELQAICREKNIDLPINSQNKRHLVRAIELGGLINHKKQLRKDTLVVGIATSRDILRERIEKRAAEMVAAGVVGEVALMGARYQWKGEVMKGNIYRIFRGVVGGEKSIEEATEEFVRSDMALAKRQMTWFKRNPSIAWSADPDELLGKVDTFLDRTRS